MMTKEIKALVAALRMLIKAAENSNCDSMAIAKAKDAVNAIKEMEE